MAAVIDEESTVRPEDVEAEVLGWAPPLVNCARSRQVNGETEALTEHLRFLRIVGGDTSIDQPWEVDTSLFARFQDAYVSTVAHGWILLKGWILGVPLAVAFLPVLLLARLHAARLPTSGERLHRGFIFYLLLMLEVLLGLPFLLLTLVSLFLDSVIYYVSFIPFCLLTCGRSRYLEGRKALRPFRGGPSLLRCFPDLAVLIAGQVLRQGCAAFLTNVVGMVLVNPVLKYFVNANPFVYCLEERFINQMSTSWRDMPVSRVMEETGRLVCDAKPSSPCWDLLAHARFLPHCPRPPEGRRWALGMQAVGSTALLMHVTHKTAIVEGVSESIVVSNSCLMPVFRMVLWYNNPFHVFTGYVEVQVTTGMPSQLDRFRGVEHAMWLVSGHTPLLARRESKMGLGCLDRHFEQWLPDFTYELRKLIRGKEAADALKAQALSADGRQRVSKSRVPWVD